jgi:hypothetical protein
MQTCGSEFSAGSDRKSLLIRHARPPRALAQLKIQFGVLKWAVADRRTLRSIVAIGCVLGYWNCLRIS